MRKLPVSLLALIMNPLLAHAAAENAPAVRISPNLMILGGLFLLILFAPFVYRALNRQRNERDDTAREGTRD